MQRRAKEILRTERRLHLFFFVFVLYSIRPGEICDFLALKKGKINDKRIDFFNFYGGFVVAAASADGCWMLLMLSLLLISNFLILFTIQVQA